MKQVELGAVFCPHLVLLQDATRHKQIYMENMFVKGKLKTKIAQELIEGELDS